MIVESVSDFLTKMDLSAVVRTFSTITLQQWFGLAIGPIAYFFGARIREYLPLFGIGRHLLTGRLERKQSLLGHFFFRLNYSLLPLLGGVVLLNMQQFFSSFVLLSIGLPSTLYLVFNHEKFRMEIKFHDNCFKVNNVKYRYDQITAIEKLPGTVRLKTNKGLVTLSSDEYRLVEPALLQHGYGDDSEPAKTLDLR